MQTSKYLKAISQQVGAAVTIPAFVRFTVGEQEEPVSDPAP
jgi:hypothetical protein